MHAAAPDDQQLLAAFAAQKSDDAFRALVDRHAPWLFAAAHRQLHNHDLAHDATQIVFILLLKRSAAMRSHPQLTTWLFSTLRYTVKNLLRTERRRHFHELRAALRNPEPHAPAPAIDPDLSAQLDSAVSALAPVYRSALLLRFYQDLPFEQIALLLNISEAAARKRTTRAVDLLRKKLGTPAHSLSAASLPLLLAPGLHPAPHTLAHSIATMALAAKAGAALPASLAVATKGTALLMATSKLQTAAVLVAACLFIAVPATIITLRQKAPASPAAPAPDDYLAYYSLQPAEALKLVTNAPLPARAALLADSDPTPPPADKFVTIRWDNDRPTLWSYGDTIPLNDILEVYMGIFPQTLNFKVPLAPNTPTEFINFDHATALPQLKGDFLVRSGATPDQYRASLQSILTQSLGRPVTVSFRDLTEKAIVLRGIWQYTPHQPHAPPAVSSPPILEIFGPTLDHNLDLGIFATGDKDYFAGHLGAWINEPVFIEADNFPSATTAHFNNESFNDPQIHDKTLVLNHLAEQTGLAWSEETRTVRHLFIESPK